MVRISMMKLMVLVIVAVLLGGCAFIKPETKIRVNPGTGNVDITNSKDVNISASKIKAKNGDKELEVEDLTMSDKSSPVIDANVKQMLAFAEQQRAANEGIAIALSGVNETIKSLLPYLNLTPNTLAAVLNQLKQVDLQIDIAQKTLKMGDAALATQPAAITEAAVTESP